MITLIKNFFSWLFAGKDNKNTDRKALEKRITELEELSNLQAQALTAWIGEVKKFRQAYVEDVRVVCNAVANLDKRVSQIEELFAHLNSQVAEIEQIIDGEDENEDIEFTGNPNNTDLN